LAPDILARANNRPFQRGFARSKIDPGVQLILADSGVRELWSITMESWPNTNGMTASCVDPGI
jgi:hypothetical protein